MDFLIAAHSLKGYPLIVFYAVGLIGFLLVVARPYWAFLFAVFGLAARNFNGAVFTRSPLLGQYCNLNDLLLWIALLALIRLAFQTRDPWSPKIIWAILAINFLGAMQSIYVYGFIPDVERSIWAELIFPLAFLAAANFVDDAAKARDFYWALFLGAVVAALQHGTFIARYLNSSLQFGTVRTITYMFSGGIFLAVSAIFMDLRNLLPRRSLALFWFAGISLIGFSYLMSLTRTLYSGVAAAILGVFLFVCWGKGKVLYRFAYSTGAILLVTAGVAVWSSSLFPRLDLQQKTVKTMGFLQHKNVFNKLYKTREEGYQTDMKLWRDGSLVWGVGTTYPPSLAAQSLGENSPVGALGHVGFSTYLVHFGLVGLLVYWLLLPWLTIKIGKNLYLSHPDDYAGALVLAAVALSFYDLVTIVSSNHYLGATSQIPGFIYGALWGLSRQKSPVRSTVPLKSRPRPLLFEKEMSKNV